MTNDTIRAQTGEVNDSRPLVGFLYDLMRDHLPVGTVQKLVNDSEAISPACICRFTNGHLARCAQMFADALSRELKPGQCVFGFTPNPACDNCDGTGIFSETDDGDPEDACAFCLEDAIKRGELDGTIDRVEWQGGKPINNEKYKGVTEQQIREMLED